MEGLTAALLTGLGIWRLVRFVRNVGKGPDLSVLPAIDAEFRALRVEGASPEYCFDGACAEIVDEQRGGEMDQNAGIFTLQRITRFARNAHGEYFYFVSEGKGKPFFKHVSHVNAKAALGKKYVAPARGA